MPDTTKIVNHIYNVLISKDLYYITPNNLDSEKKRFFSHLTIGKEYNPIFSYRKIRFDTNKIKKKIKQLEKYDGPNNNIIKNFYTLSGKYLQLIMSRGKQNFTHISVKVYGKPNSEAIKYSESIIKRHHTKERRLTNPIQVKKILKEILKKYNWKIQIVRDLSSRVELDRTKRITYINRNSIFYKNDINKLIVHEIDTHIKRNINNKKFIKPLFRNCFDYIETEEGLAIKNEEINNCLTLRALKICAARLLAINWGLTNNFYNIFKRIKRYGFSDEEAFMITVRVKRGLDDTSKPGSFTRDHIYISGKLKIDHFLKKGGNLRDLFMGKIGINDIKYLKDIMTREGLCELTQKK